ncbi:MAG: STAS domain-containing protein [Methylobacter sp.]
MATNEENNLIGYDPLAWMDSDTDINEEHLVIDDLVGDNDEIATLDITKEDDDTVIDKTEEESPSEALIEEAADASIELDDTLAEEAMSDSIAAAVADDLVLEKTEDSSIDLDSTLTIQNVVKLHEKLKNLLAMHDEIEINASNVSSIDTATLQLLVSLKKESIKLQKKVTIIYPSPRFVESAQLLGLLAILDIHDA